LNDGVGETTGIALGVIVAGVADTNGTLNGEGVFLVTGPEEVEIVIQGRRVEVVPPHNDERIVEDFVRELGLEGMEGGECEGISASGCHGVSITGWL
jgi:hypothetical protein